MNGLPSWKISHALRFIESNLISQPTQASNSLMSAIIRGIRCIRKKDWVVKEADKNLGLTLMSQAVYQDLVRSQVAEGVFSEVDLFPYESILSNLGRILAHCGLSPREQTTYLESAREHKEPASFHVLPKIHKAMLKTRPITAQHSYMLSKLSADLANILNAIVARIPAITTNCQQVVNQLETIQVPEDAVLLTYDVESCYPSVDIPDALRALSQAYPNVFLSRMDSGYASWNSSCTIVMCK